MSLKVKISQTVLLNISDHWTRNRIQNATNSFRVVGALMGKTEGRIMHIFQSTELTASVDGNQDEFSQIDHEYMNDKLNLLKQVFSDYELLGWYFTLTPLHNQITNQDKLWHKSFIKFTENPIMLILGTEKLLFILLKDPWQNMKASKELSLNCYEINNDQMCAINSEIEVKINKFVIKVDGQSGSNNCTEYQTDDAKDRPVAVCLMALPIRSFA